MHSVYYPRCNSGVRRNFRTPPILHPSQTWDEWDEDDGDEVLSTGPEE